VKFCLALARDLSLLRPSVLARVLLAFLTACGATHPGGPPQGLEPSSIEITGAHSFVVSPILFQGSDGRINYHITVTNRAASPIQVGFGDCWGFLQLFSTAARRGTPVFDEGNLGNQSCVLYHRTDTLGVGESITLTRMVPTSMLLGIPGGHYFGAVRSAPNGQKTTSPSGELDYRP
jgi:hypothetical protein